MDFPKSVDLLYVPAGIDIEADVVELTDELIEKAMSTAWWNDAAIDTALAAKEIDREWDWTDLEIERDGRVLGSQKFAVVTGDGAVQGAMMISTEPVACERKPERGEPALFVELLFAAPRTRHWLRSDKAEQFRGVGLHLLRTAAELSLEAGFDGRLKLESSPGFVEWYKKRGLLQVSARRILHERVRYTPMELPAGRVAMLLPERKRGE